MAIAQKMAIGPPGAADRIELPLASFAIEIDLNLDGLPEIFAYRYAPGCDAVDCGIRR